VLNGIYGWVRITLVSFFPQQCTDLVSISFIKINAKKHRKQLKICHSDESKIAYPATGFFNTSRSGRIRSRLSAADIIASMNY
jgi:hypothetical protein